MSEWSLPTVLGSLHEDVQQQLSLVRKSFVHPGTKGDGTEKVWLDLFNQYLPKRYCASSAHIVDSLGKFSDQIDIVVYDRQYSPFVFNYNDQLLIPAESVYAVFEVKQSMDRSMIEYAQNKVRSVRSLHRTSLDIPYAGGKYPAKPPIEIIAGILTLESEWNPALGKSLTDQLRTDLDLGKLNLGCAAQHGYFCVGRDSGEYELNVHTKAATAFLLKLISELQFSGTVPMIDVMAYSKWLES